MNSWLLFSNDLQIIVLIILTIFSIVSSQKLIADDLVRELGSVILNDERRYYGEYCDQNNNTNNDHFIYKKCHQKFYCHKNQCKCPTGFGYLKLDLLILQYSEECLKFNEFLCTKDSDCQDVDNNRFCNMESNKCECNKGFYEENDSKLCKSQLNQTCFSDADCDIDYTHCKNSVCECWPEFEVLESTGDNQFLNFCTRKICSNNLNCQTSDNPNLICNNTICECEYGYSLDNKRICVKITKRQNCNITCQIIGGLFASIFMLSLIYWCFYCCYSIVKNYKSQNHNRDSIHNNNNQINENLPERERFTQSSSNPSIVIRRDHFLNQRPDYRYSYYYESENPPTYSQLIDPPPDYETVLHMKINE